MDNHHSIGKDVVFPSPLHLVNSDGVPQAHHARTVECLGNYRRIRQILDELCAINRELLRRREAF